MPPLLPPCLEVPGYMIPHAQLPILDYRRMTPHVAPTIAHHTHRSHFQNSVPVGRVMVSSEVQTEPLCHSIDSHGHAARSQTCSESGRGTGCGSPVSTSPCSSDNKSVACPEGTSTMTQNCNATNTIDITGLSAVPKSEVLQAERVQIKCNEMPSGLKVFQNMELVSQNETDLLQCSLASVQSSEDVVLCSYQSLAVRKDKQKVEAGMLRYSSKHCLPACTEVTVVRTSPSCRTFKTYPKPSRSVVTQSLKAKKKSEMPFHTEVKEDGNSSNVPFKIMRLPFDIQYHDQPCQLEASIWSVESLMPYVPANEWMVENGFLTPQKPLSPQIKFSDVLSKPNQSYTNVIPVGENQQTGASTKREDSISSLKAHSPYRPSTSWLADFGNVYYYSKLPIVQQQPNISERRLPKMSLTISLESSPLRNGKETRNQRPAIGVSDQKHSSFHTCKCKAKSSPRLAGSAMTCGWVSHSTLEKKLPFCTSCRYNMKGKDHRKFSFSDGLCCKREEIAEMITFDDEGATEGVHDIQQMILGSHVTKCCAAYQPKIRAQTGLFENYQCLNASPAQDKCADLEWRTWEKSGKDCIINPNERLLQRLQKGRAANRLAQILYIVCVCVHTCVHTCTHTLYCYICLLVDDAMKGRMQAPKTERRIQKKERKEYLQGKKVNSLVRLPFSLNY